MIKAIKNILININRYILFILSISPIILINLLDIGNYTYFFGFLNSIFISIWYKILYDEFYNSKTFIQKYIGDIFVYYTIIGIGIITFKSIKFQESETDYMILFIYLFWFVLYILIALLISIGFNRKSFSNISILKSKTILFLVLYIYPLSFLILHKYLVSENKDLEILKNDNS